MKEEIKKTLLELRETNYGIALKSYLKEKIQELNNVSTITGTVEEKGRLVSARDDAIRILKGCFWFLGEKEEPKKKPNQYE